MFDKNENIEFYKALEEEIERVEYHMYNVLRMDRKQVEEINRLVDIELEKRLKHQFDNYAEVGNINVGSQKE